MKKALAVALVITAQPAISETQRELGSHEHGVGELNIAAVDQSLVFELHAPGADIVGFEYVAETEADRGAISDALGLLTKPLDLFELPEAAGCFLTEVYAALELEEDDHAEHDDDHEEHSDHDDHDKDEEHAEHDHDEHDHDEHAEHDDHDKHEEHAEGEEHHDHDDHEEHADEASHSEFYLEFAVTCTNPDKIDTMAFKYFETFEAAEELEVQIVTEDGAQAFEVMRSDPNLSLRGVF
ncbi:MAG: DUF2796 domain-containing protein [Pseudomonadota bacterium]